jgi:hypothetical protein
MLPIGAAAAAFGRGFVLQGQESRTIKGSCEKVWGAQQNRPTGQPFISRPFVQRLPGTVSKVDLGFLKHFTQPTKPDSTSREPDPTAPGCSVSKKRPFSRAGLVI